MKRDRNSNHQKHAKLTRPALGQFARQEWAVLGTPCGNIQQLAGFAIAQLRNRYRFGYVDAEHGEGRELAVGSLQSAPAVQTEAERSLTLTSGADREEAGRQGGSSPPPKLPLTMYTDRISHHALEWEGQPDAFEFRRLFNGLDAVLVNGNHFKAARQLVVLDPKKEESLSRKLDRLTAVELFLTTPEQKEPYDFLKEHLPHWRDIPLLDLSDGAGLARWLDEKLQDALPPLYGLVLAGGESRRMGRDKGAMDYHGKPQREHMAGLLQPLCERVWMSVRPGQAVETAFPLLEDTFLGLGPYGAILSAFREHPDAAWLVVACDLPLLDGDTLAQLVQARNPSQVATAFQSPDNEFPEPLIAVWEPRSYPVLLQFLAQGYSCPRKVLINSAIERIEAARPEALANVNTPEDVRRIMNKEV